jgi:predicted MPP superfamily phosphohydrolase
LRQSLSHWGLKNPRGFTERKRNKTSEVILRILHISDTHASLDQGFYDLPASKSLGENVLVHTGDYCSGWGDQKEHDAFALSYGSLPASVRLLVPGNHDINLFTYFDLERGWLKEQGVTLLWNEHICIQSAIVVGLVVPWEQEFSKLASEALNFATEVAFEKSLPLWVLSHVPPAAKTWGDPKGNKNLAVSLEEIEPQLILSGHVHEGRSVQKTPWGGIFSNACSCKCDRPTKTQWIEGGPFPILDWGWIEILTEGLS